MAGGSAQSASIFGVYIWINMDRVMDKVMSECWLNLRVSR